MFTESGKFTTTCHTGILFAQRLVLDNTGTVRAYTMQDLLTCCVFGFTMQAGTMCQLDFAVTPDLAAQLCEYLIKIKPIYVQDQATAILAALSLLPDLILAVYIGGIPSTLQEYVSRSNCFIILHSELVNIPKPTYAKAGTPQQLYFLTQFACMRFCLHGGSRATG